MHWYFPRSITNPNRCYICMNLTEDLLCRWGVKLPYNCLDFIHHQFLFKDSLHEILLLLKKRLRIVSWSIILVKDLSNILCIFLSGCTQIVCLLWAQYTQFGQVWYHLLKLYSRSIDDAYIAAGVNFAPCRALQYKQVAYIEGVKFFLSNCQPFTFSDYCYLRRFINIKGLQCTDQSLVPFLRIGQLQPAQS